MITFHLFSRSIPLVRQSEAAECGLACLAMIAGKYGARETIHQLRQRHSISIRGTSLRQLMDIAAAMGFGTRAIRCELGELEQVRMPAVLHWNLNHFVVLEKVTKKGLKILDPAFGERFLTFAKASEAFTGVVLELSPAKDFSRDKTSRQERLSLGDLIPFSPAFWRSMAQALVLSMLLQMLLLCAPLFVQLVIDQGILRSSPPVLLVLVVGFGLLKIFEIMCDMTRSLVLQYIATIVSFDMESGMFHHLLRLPLAFFQKRFIGDIQQRFSALQTIQNLIVNTTIATIIDGVLAVTIGIVLFSYSPILTSITLIAMAIYASIKLALLNLSRKFSMETMLADADKQSHFLETLRAVQILKTAGMETQRESRWRNLAMLSLGARVKLGNLNIILRTTNALVLGASSILVVYLAASRAISGSFSIGMIVAFLAYKQQFESRLLALLEAYFSYKLLDVNLERVADIVLSEREMHEGLDSDHLLRGAIQLKNVSFAYAKTEPLALIDVNLHIRAGDFVVFVGPSGSGKSTLLKLMIGILEPITGDVLFDGKPISSVGTKSIRKQIGVVMQDDSLLSGTIAQNISLFDDKLNGEEVRRAAQLASVDKEVDAMQMGFSSLVGDMGTSLSGGQKQRILLARALYRHPRILVLDEGTSHLDLGKEQEVNSALRALNITRIMAAHRKETIAAADRVFEVNNGRVVEITGSMGSNFPETTENSTKQDHATSGLSSQSNP
mgnify:FL=1